MEAELRQLELAEKRRLLVSVEKVGQDLSAIVMEIKQTFLAVTPRLAAELSGGEKDLVVAQDKIERALHEALIRLSKFDPDLVGR